MNRYTLPLGFLRDVFMNTGAPLLYVKTSPYSKLKTMGTISVASAEGDHPAMSVIMPRPEAPYPPIFPAVEATYYVSQSMLDGVFFDQGIRAWSVDWSGLLSRPEMPQK